MLTFLTAQRLSHTQSRPSVSSHFMLFTCKQQFVSCIVYVCLYLTTYTIGKARAYLKLWLVVTIKWKSQHKFYLADMFGQIPRRAQVSDSA
jgi:hypothetical protein